MIEDDLFARPQVGGLLIVVDHRRVVVPLQIAVHRHEVAPRAVAARPKTLTQLGSAQPLHNASTRATAAAIKSVACFSSSSCGVPRAVLRCYSDGASKVRSCGNFGGSMRGVLRIDHQRHRVGEPNRVSGGARDTARASIPKSARMTLRKIRLRMG